MPGSVRNRRSNSSGDSRPARSSDGATLATTCTGRERPPSTWSRSHSQEGIWRSCSGLGWIHSRTAGSGSLGGPGARSPKRCTSCRKPAKASIPVTFCSMIVGTSDSITRPVALIRQCWLRRHASRSGSGGTNPLGSSYAPSMRGTESSAHSAPLPQAVAVTTPVGVEWLDLQRGGALGGADAAPGRAVTRPAEGRIAAATSVGAHDQRDRAGPVGPPLAHERSGRHGSTVCRRPLTRWVACCSDDWSRCRPPWPPPAPGSPSAT